MRLQVKDDSRLRRSCSFNSQLLFVWQARVGACMSQTRQRVSGLVSNELRQPGDIRRLRRICDHSEILGFDQPSYTCRWSSLYSDHIYRLLPAWSYVPDSGVVVPLIIDLR